ncbi:MAG: glycosyltransferase [Rhodoferax sp.]|nr:glycosyltransferase [Rhodoferax sp.]
MIVSIGILAYNEAAGIATTIASLLAQSAFHASHETSAVREWEIIVVPNGCSDTTDVVAANALNALAPSVRAGQLTHSVRVLKQGGKSNAWNQYIHEISRKDADVIVMVDADIEFGHVDTVLNCLAELRTNRRAKVVVDLPLKDFLKKPKLSWLESMSAKTSNVQLGEAVGISGQFYCASAQLLRQVWMPNGLSAEDGFLKGMVITDMFRSEPDLGSVVRADNASHYYKGLTGLRDVFHHELRMVIGTSMNCYFMWDFLKFATDPKGPGAGALIRNQLAVDPNWYRKTVENQIKNRGWFVFPRGMMLQRFNSMRGLSWQQKLGRLPVALVGTLLDIPTYWMASRKLRSGRALGFW